MATKLSSALDYVHGTNFASFQAPNAPAAFVGIIGNFSLSSDAVNPLAATASDPDCGAKSPRTKSAGTDLRTSCMCCDKFRQRIALPDKTAVQNRAGGSSPHTKQFTSDSHIAATGHSNTPSRTQAQQRRIAFTEKKMRCCAVYRSVAGRHGEH